MATIELYKSKINSMANYLNQVRTAVDDFSNELSGLKTKILGINSNLCDSVVNKISTSSKTQEQQIAGLEATQRQVNEFINLTVGRDNSAASEVSKQKEAFYKKYTYLKPKCEKSGWEKFCDKLKDVGEWCKEHWKLIVTVVICIAAIALICTGVGGILGAAALGALIGAGTDGLMGGISSVLQGGSFLDGFEEGAFSGAISGAIMGGIGGAGAMLGNSLKCADLAKKGMNLAKFIKITSKVSGGLSSIMGGFDTLSMVLGKFDSDNPITALNNKLHQSTIYNVFQTSVGVVSTFTGAASQTMACFIAGTVVLTTNGLIAIEKLKAGDKVISTNPDTLETSENTILETYVRKVDKLVHLVINGEEIVTTDNHPFYVQGRGFIEAGNLLVGDKLIGANGEDLFVESHTVELTDEPVSVYNFNVDDAHTYFVGECGVWVHNANCKLIKNSDGSYDAELSYKDDWTPEQRAEADAKCKALSDADTVKTDVAGKRDGTKTSRYRKDNSIPSNQDVDHTIDLQLGGADDVKNMNGLDKSVNRSLGKQINLLIKDLPKGTVLKNFIMK